MSLDRQARKSSNHAPSFPYTRLRPPAQYQVQSAGGLCAVRASSVLDIGSDAGAKLLGESMARKADLQSVDQLREGDARVRGEVEEEFREEIRASALKERVQSSSAASEKAEKTTEYASTSARSLLLSVVLTMPSLLRRHLAGELARLRRLMRSQATPDQPLPESSPT
jgi:hypothetical protein